MKIAFITECDYFFFAAEAEGCDLVLFPFYRAKVINYGSEIKGDTDFFRTLTGLSKALKATVIAGADTDSYGLIRRSVAVCDNGKLLGISDLLAVSEGEPFTCGAFYRVYDTRAGRVGVAVGSDGASSDCVRALASCGADVIVNIAEKMDGKTLLSARAKALEFGTPIAVCAEGGACLAGTNGEALFASPMKISTFSVRPGRDYHVVTCRRRGKRFTGDK